MSVLEKQGFFLYLHMQHIVCMKIFKNNRVYKSDRLIAYIVRRTISSVFKGLFNLKTH